MCSKKTKDINVKAFNTITEKKEAKAKAEHIPYDSKCKYNSTTYNSIQERNNKTCRTCQCECKNYCKCEKDYSWNPNTRIQESSKYLKSVADTSVTECDEITIALDNIAKTTKKTNTMSTKLTNTITTKMTNTITKKRTNIIAINVASTTSINCPSKKVRDFYI